MDLGQLTVAIIGATSTLVAAWLGSRSRLKVGTIPSKKSVRRRLVKFGFYFLLGGLATYWVMNWLLPVGWTGDRLHALQIHSDQISRPGVAFAQDRDSVAPPSVPVGSLILSVLPPDKLGQLPGGSIYWAPADGRTLDSTSSYAVLTGNTKVPDLRGLSMNKSLADMPAADSVAHRIRLTVNDAGRGDTAIYWYIRIN